MISQRKDLRKIARIVSDSEPKTAMRRTLVERKNTHEEQSRVPMCLWRAESLMRLVRSNESIVFVASHITDYPPGWPETSKGARRDGESSPNGDLSISTITALFLWNQSLSVGARVALHERRRSRHRFLRRQHGVGG